MILVTAIAERILVITRHYCLRVCAPPRAGQVHCGYDDDGFLRGQSLTIRTFVRACVLSGTTIYSGDGKVPTGA